MLQEQYKYKPFYGFRVVAIVSVILFHYFINVGFDRNLVHPLGIIFFRTLFFGSAFFLTRQLLQEISIRGSINFKNFYGRRILRTWVLYYIGLILYGLFSDPPKIGFWPYVVFIQNWFKDDFYLHSWSLALEEQFYLLLPFLMLLMTKKNITFVLSLLSIIGIVILSHPEWLPNISRNSLYWTDAFWVGMMFAFFEKSNFVANILKYGRWLQFVLLGLMLFIVFLGNKIGSGGPLIASIIVGIWCFSFLSEDTFFAKFLSKKIFYKLSQLSYSWYIFHRLVFDLVLHSTEYDFKSTVLGKITLIALSMAGTYAVSIISWRFIEKPLLKIRDKYFPSV